MGYYMQFIVTDDTEVSLAILERALQEKDPVYSVLERHENDSGEYGELRWEGDLYGVLEINRRSIAKEIDGLKEELREVGGERSQYVLQALNDCKAVVVVQVLWQGRDTESTLEKIDPIWEWLFANCSGLLHVDAEGYYDRTDLILDIG